jgi:hypothetical protein
VGGNALMFTTFPKETTIIYLDQNKWNDLSCAYYGMPEGKKFRHVLEKIQTAISNKSAILPLSFEHYFETNKDPDVERRKRLAKVLAKISQGIAISPQERTTQLELTRALAELYNEPIPKTLSMIGYGFPCVIGESLIIEDQNGSYIMKDRNGNFVTLTREQVEGIRDRITSPDLIFKLLIEVDNNEFNKWVQEFQTSHAKLATNLERFRQEVRRDDKTLHKSAYAEQLATALEDEISKALSHFNKTTEEFFSISAEKLDAFWENVPTLDVEIALNAGRNEHWRRTIEPNDVTDISFLNVAIPYCDVLVVEKYFHNLIKQIGLDKKYKTQIFRNINDLEEILV